MGQGPVQLRIGFHALDVMPIDGQFRIDGLDEFQQAPIVFIRQLSLEEPVFAVDGIGQVLPIGKV